MHRSVEDLQIKAARLSAKARECFDRTDYTSAIQYQHRAARMYLRARMYARAAA